MQQTDVRLKLELNGEVRRVTLLEKSFQCLQKQVCKLFSFQDTNFSLKYKDDEGDLVTISSEEEFIEALGSLQNNLLRLKITKLNKEIQEGEQERGGRCGRFRKFMEFKKWKEAQKTEDNEDKEEDGEEEECKPWKRFFVFKSPHGPQHPRHPHHHFHHHQREEEQGENGQQHPFFPPRFGPHPHQPHHFHRHHHHHGHQNEQEGEKQNFFSFPPRPHHPHHFHRHHHHGHQEQEEPRFRFPPRDAPFGFFGRHHHRHQHQQEQEDQKEQVRPFEFFEKLGKLAKNLFGEELNEESSLEELLEKDIFKVEHNYICDGCDQKITGTRHHCTECSDFDFCSSCFETKLESHAQHKFEKVTAFEALKQALQNGQQIDAFFVKRNEEESSNEAPKQEENKSNPQPEPEPEQPKQEEQKQEEEVSVISNNVEVPQPSETSIAIEPSTNVTQPPIEKTTEPKPTEEVVVYPFQKKLEDLEVMGFTDRKKNILALLKNKGDLELTIEQLLN